MQRNDVPSVQNRPFDKRLNVGLDSIPTMHTLSSLVALAITTTIIISNLLSQPISAADFGSNNPTEVPKSGNVDVLESDVIADLEKAQQFLQRAAAVHVTIANCKTQINAALNSVEWVETLLLEDDYEESSKHLVNAKRTLSDCNAVLSTSSIQLSQAVLYLTKQALAQIENAATSLTLLESLKSKNSAEDAPEVSPKSTDTSNGSGGCNVDGTKCQFSPCATGTGLRKCSFGFAAGVTGGANGKTYTVTNSEDSPQNPQPGSLRYAVNLAATEVGGVWITFSQDMVIRLKEMLWIKSSTTIDGRGVNVTIIGRSMVLAGVHNVILHNFQINSMGESDTVHIFAGSTQVWVDHVTSFAAKLGLVSVVQGSTDVTISNCYLTNPNFNMLLGASDADLEDQRMRISVYRNWFKDSMQRMPHCRWGYCHVVNNLYSNWGYYAIGARAHAKVLSESNVFVAARKTEATPWFSGSGGDFDSTATIQSVNDLLLNGTTFHQFLKYGPASSPQYRVADHYPPIHATATLANFITHCAGALTTMQKVQECRAAV